MTSEFKSWKGFRQFAQAVKTTTRFLLDAESAAFLKTVAITSHSRETTVKKGQILFRAQLGHNIQPEFQYDEGSQEGVHVNDWFVPFDESRLRPTTDRAHEGRANPKGVPVFYSALDKATAIAEVRPWIGTYVSYGRFEATRDLRMVNCAENYKGPRTVSMVLKYMACEPDSLKKEECVWHDIDEAFSEPITRNDDLADYVPTQILAELFRRERFDGIIFRSSIESGKNIVLFHLDDARFVQSGIVKINTVAVQYYEDTDRCF